ncbi:metallophosphoesterase [Sorangium sp. So ce260]|uniref:lipase/acyltransferase domain-containing protein n=1 Tax=Sorangium sp. So ce260 TaxID=3133291 RepID=UPI003F628738
MARLTASEIESLNAAGLRLAFGDREAAPSLRAYFGPEHAGALAASLLPDALAPFAQGTRRTVLLLPGFLGSGLVDHGRLFDDLVWVDLPQLLLYDGLDRLELDEDGARDRLPGAQILPGRPLRLFYDLLGAHLAVRGGCRVEPVAFDWRRRIDESAGELHRKIEMLNRGDPERQVSLVAHSMGCLVCKRYFQLYPEAAERRIEHAVFIGPPLQGTFAPAELLSGEHEIVRRFGAYAPLLRSRLLRVFRTFPGLYELLPDPVRFRCEALFEPPRWEAGRVVGRLLEEGREVGERLRAPHALMQRTSIVLSASVLTTAGARFDHGTPTFDRTARGDGTVLVESAWEDGAAGHFEAPGEHNVLPLFPEVREGVLQLLLTRGEEGWPLRKLSRPEDARGETYRWSASLGAREAAASLALRERIRAGVVTGSDVFWLLGAGRPPEPRTGEIIEAAVLGREEVREVSAGLDPLSAIAERRTATARKSIMALRDAPAHAELVAAADAVHAGSLAAAPARRTSAEEPLLAPEEVEELRAAFGPADAAPMSDAALKLVARPRSGAAGLVTPPGSAALFASGSATAEAFPAELTWSFGDWFRGAGRKQLGAWILKTLDYRVDDPREPPPLTKAQVDTIARIYRKHPKAIEILLRIALKRALSAEEGPDAGDAARRVLQDASAFFDAPDPVKWLEAQHEARDKEPPPPGLAFDDYDAAGLPVRPESVRFQPVDDLLGWLVHAAAPAVRYHLLGEGIADFRMHPTYDSGFDYPLSSAAPGGPISVAVLGDFATGSYASKYIARRVVRGGFDCAVHLGDVYYAGRRSELDAGLREPLGPMLGQTALYLLAGNHEMYSGGYPLLDFIDAKRRAHPDVQRQEGPYFRLYSEHFQVIGLDTEWGGHGHVSDQQKQWLRDVVEQGKRKGRINLLMTSSEPYSYGSGELEPLLDDVLDAAGQDGISAWFWGNTHYFALFRRSTRAPFIGCCAGHGGYPYKRLRPGLPCPVQPEFTETAGRFSDDVNARSDRGNNGYCELTLGPGHAMKIVYRDWTGRARCTRSLVWDPVNRVLDFPTR